MQPGRLGDEHATQPQTIAAAELVAVLPRSPFWLGRRAASSDRATSSRSAGRVTLMLAASPGPQRRDTGASAEPGLVGERSLPAGTKRVERTRGAPPCGVWATASPSRPAAATMSPLGPASTSRPPARPGSRRRVRPRHRPRRRRGPSRQRPRTVVDEHDFGVGLAHAGPDRIRRVPRHRRPRRVGVARTMAGRRGPRPDPAPPRRSRDGPDRPPP